MTPINIAYLIKKRKKTFKIGKLKTHTPTKIFQASRGHNQVITHELN
jgi:hypothetical protein